MKHSYNYYISFSYIILKPKANPSVQALGIVRFYSHERSEFTSIFNSIFISTLSNLNLERISNGKVKIEHIAKPVDIEESAVPGVEGGMQTDAEVEAKHEEVEVVAESQARADGDVFQRTQTQGRIGPQRIVAQKPDVANIQKECAVKRSEKVGA